LPAGLALVVGGAGGCSLTLDPVVGDPDRCASHAACSNGDPCDGQERCEPSSAEADGRGCVGGVAPSVDDGVECTVDACDPETGLATHDASGCGCLSDAQCQFEQSAPCMAWSCDLSTQTCASRLADEGVECETGVACAPLGACDAQGACLARPSEEGDAECGDGQFCNGEERCEPSSPEAGPDGCAPGEAPVSEEAAPACGAWVCDEERRALTLVLGPACECRVDADCPARGCETYGCDVGTGACAPQGLLDEGAACDDGVGCTFGERCDGQGACVGQPSVAWCAVNRPCDPTQAEIVPVCEPESGCGCVQP
jgi:hypothetical protein